MQTSETKTARRAPVSTVALPPIKRKAVSTSTPAIQTASMRVSSPSDPAEKEADGTAKKIMRMAIPEGSIAYVKSPLGGGVYRQMDDPKKRPEDMKKDDLKKDDKKQLMRSPYIARFESVGLFRSQIQRKTEGQPDLSSNLSAEIQMASSSGKPLPAGLRKFMEPRFKADFSNVKVHTDEKAAKLNRQVNAHAFAVGNQVFFGKDKFQPETPHGKELIAHELTHTIQQGAATQQQGSAGKPGAVATPALVNRPEPVIPPAPVTRPVAVNLPAPVSQPAAGIHRSENVSVTQSAPVHVQRGIISEALDYFADKANIIPGFRMFTIIIGVNPINMSSVDASAANILRAIVEFMPGGNLITRALDAYGIFDKIGNWISAQLKSLGITGPSIRAAVMQFADSLGPADAFRLGSVWDRAKAIFTGPIESIISFAKGLASQVLDFIKDAILKPIGALASKTSGWDLLKAILGRDPITGEAFPQTADTLIGGFMKLIGQEEIYNNLKKANGVARALAWFLTAKEELLSFVAQIPPLFMTALKSLTIMDVVVLPLAFAKVATVFGNFLGKFTSWAGNTIWKLLEIIFDVVSPGAWGYIQKTGAALKSILQNPLPFVGNLVKAAKAGFMNFGSNFLGHLKAGLIDWLTGSLTGVYIPKAFTLIEIVKFVFSVLGLSWANIRGKLVKVLGEPAVKGLEGAYKIVTTLMTQGPAAAWEEIKSQLASLRDSIVSGITDFVVDAVVKKAIPKLIAMFIPGAGFISAILSIYDTVMVFVNKISKIVAVVTGFINSIVAIAAGNIGAASARVEGILAGLLSLAINFLAGFAGLGKIADKVMGVVTKIRGTVDKAIDWLINLIVSGAKKLFGALFGKDKNKPADTRTETVKKADLHKGVTDGEALLKAKNATADGVRGKLPALVTKYRLVRLTLVDGGSNKYKITGEVNPPEEGNLVTLAPDFGGAIGDQVIVLLGADWKLATIDQYDAKLDVVFSKHAKGRLGFPLAVFKTSLTGGGSVVKKFDPNAKGSGPYSHLSDQPDVGPYKAYTGLQKAAIIAANRAKNGGSLVSDEGGALVLTTKRAKGAKVDPNEVNIDHHFPRSAGGWNSYGNARVLSFSQNLKKLDAIPDKF